MDGHRAPLSYHARMLADVHRMDAYERAIRTLVRPGDVVLDLGTGTGILALLAARRGARVHAVESMRVAAVAEALAHANGLADRITVHRADARMLAPIEPVDLVISDCLGCFLVDDNMLPAAAAAARWLKPEGRFCPRQVRLYVAPVGELTLPTLGVFGEPFYGLDLGAAMPFALSTVATGNVAPRSLLAPPLLYGQYDLRQAPASFDCTLTWTVARDGELTAFAGWFEADLADGVLLSNGPGIETHWGQLLFPLPPARVRPGERVEVRLQLGADQLWAWQGSIGDRPFALDERWSATQGQRGASTGAIDLDALLDQGDGAFSADDYSTAADAYAGATACLPPSEDALAPPIYENLGLALWKLGRYGAAARAFLRALDGDARSRQQSLAILVSCLFRSGATLDGERYLALYQATFGDHPEGWRRT